MKPDGSSPRKEKSHTEAGGNDDLCLNCRDINDWKPMRRHPASLHNSSRMSDVPANQPSKSYSSDSVGLLSNSKSSDYTVSRPFKSWSSGVTASHLSNSQSTDSPVSRLSNSQSSDSTARRPTNSQSSDSKASQSSNNWSSGSTANKLSSSRSSDSTASRLSNSQASDSATSWSSKEKTPLWSSGKLRDSSTSAFVPPGGKRIAPLSSLKAKDDDNQKMNRQRSSRQPKVEQASQTRRQAKVDLAYEPAGFSGVVGFDGFSDNPFGSTFDTFPSIETHQVVAIQSPLAEVGNKRLKKRIPAALLGPHTYTDKYVAPTDTDKHISPSYADKYVSPTTLYSPDPIRDVEKLPGPHYVAKPYTPPKVEETDNFSDIPMYTPQTSSYSAAPEDVSSYALPYYGDLYKPKPEYKPQLPPYQYHKPNYRPPIATKPVEPLKPVIVLATGSPVHRPQPLSYSPASNPPEPLYNEPQPVYEENGGSGYNSVIPPEPYPKITSYLTPDLYPTEPENYLDPTQYFETDRNGHITEDDGYTDSKAGSSPTTSLSSSSAGPTFPFRRIHEEKKLEAGGFFTAASGRPGGIFGSGGGFAAFNIPDMSFPADFGLLTSESREQEGRTQAFQSPSRRGAARSVSIRAKRKEKA